MWQRWARSRRRCGSGEPSAVPAQMWLSAAGPVRLRRRVVERDVPCVRLSDAVSSRLGAAARIDVLKIDAPPFAEVAVLSDLDLLRRHDVRVRRLPPRAKKPALPHWARPGRPGFPADVAPRCAVGPLTRAALVLAAVERGGSERVRPSR
jgi:hypothetical protein